eukprot:Hpha_TRINITY_DN15377_c1_g1::TRINITY_DN15377_c1_g1_i1::g.88451::m.88451
MGFLCYVLFAKKEEVKCPVDAGRASREGPLEAKGDKRTNVRICYRSLHSPTRGGGRQGAGKQCPGTLCLVFTVGTRKLGGNPPRTEGGGAEERGGGCFYTIFLIDLPSPPP